MITIKQWMEAVNYRITSGSDYLWQCYGPSAWSLDAEPAGTVDRSATIIFDTVTNAVYEVCVFDYIRNKAYRLVNPMYEQALQSEARERNVDKNVAWDDVNFVDLICDDDFIEKCSAIMSERSYDTRVQIPIDLPRDELHKLMLIAHERDITLNRLVESAIEHALDTGKF